MRVTDDEITIIAEDYFRKIKDTAGEISRLTVYVFDRETMLTKIQELDKYRDRLCELTNTGEEIEEDDGEN